MTTTASQTVPDSPVSDVVYDLMQALTSKLEAIDAYEEYRQDAAGSHREIFDELITEDRRQAARLLNAIREELT